MWEDTLKCRAATRLKVLLLCTELFQRQEHLHLVLLTFQEALQKR